MYFQRNIDEQTFQNKSSNIFKLRNAIYFSSSSEFKINHANNVGLKYFI